MRFLFLSVVAAALAIVGYQLLKLDPLPVGGSGGGAATVSSRTASAAVGREKVEQVAALAAGRATVETRPVPSKSDALKSDAAAEQAKSPTEQTGGRRLSEVRIISKPLRYKSRGFLGDDGGTETGNADAHATPQASAVEGVKPRVEPMPATDAKAGETKPGGTTAAVAANGTSEDVAELPRVVRIDAAPAVAEKGSDSGAPGADVTSAEPVRVVNHPAVPVPTPAPQNRGTAVVAAVVPPLPEWSGRPPVERTALTEPVGPRSAVAYDDDVLDRAPRGRGDRDGPSKPLFQYRTHCHPAYGCERVLYARKPRNAKEARRIRKMRNRIIARRIQRYGY